MPTEENKAIARRLYEEVINRGDLDRLEEFIAPVAIVHAMSPAEEDIEAGPEFFRQLFSAQRDGLPDFRYDVEDALAEGGRVTVRFTRRGTHQGEFLVVPPTGKEVAVTGIDIVRIDEGGKVADLSRQIDRLGLMQQLGMIPVPGRPEEARPA